MCTGLGFLWFRSAIYIFNIFYIKDQTLVYPGVRWEERRDSPMVNPQVIGGSFSQVNSSLIGPKENKVAAKNCKYFCNELEFEDY